MKTIEIKHRWNGSVLFTYDVDDNDPQPMRTALLAAVRAGREPDKLREERAELESLLASNRLSKDETRDAKTLLTVVEREIEHPQSGAYLSDAYLSGADLSGADLSSANLSGANLSRAYLSGAYLSGADLSRADLSRAYLSGAYLSSADLSDADLSDADLSGADLSGADLSGADLSSANLSSANLSGANLSGAYLSRANLSGAYLSRANLSGAYLSRAYLSGAYLSSAKGIDPRTPRTDPPEPYQRIVGEDAQRRRMLRYREQHPEVPVVENLDKRILDSITAEGCRLKMSSWHGGEPENGTACGTTHCRGGWAIVLAGAAGLKLEQELGVFRAATAIYLASTGRVPHFFATDENALRDIKRCAAEAPSETTAP